MGYRNYIGSIPKPVYRKIKSFTIDECIDYFNIECIDDFRDIHDTYKEVYCFGKYCEFEPPSETIKPFFENEDLQKAVVGEDIELNIVTKDFLKYIIKHYHKKIETFYNEMADPFLRSNNGNASEFLKSKTITDFNDKFERMWDFDFSKITQKEKNALQRILHHIFSYSTEWKLLTPYNLNESLPQITDSWKYEYSIFELVHIYKTFDWNKNRMVYYGG